MTQLRSTAILLGFVALFSAISFGTWILVWQPPLPPIWRLVMASVAFGSMFGAMAWCLLTVPVAKPRNDGWRRYRFFMWWLALSAMFEGMILTKGQTFDFWRDFLPVVGITLAVTSMGWALASIRASRVDGDVMIGPES